MKKKSKSPFRTGWKDYFTFSTRERNGVYTLLLILILQITFYLYKYSSGVQQSDLRILENDAMPEWMQSAEFSEAESNEREFSEQGKTNTSEKINFFHFNPNTITKEEFLKLGLSEAQVNVILKFRTKGKGFRTKADFKKLYCIRQDEMKLLEPWLDLPDSIVYSKSSSFASKTIREFLRLELNTADTTEFDKLPGIGPAFARRIVKYRNLLGGYSSVNQLREIWGFNDTLFDLVHDHIYLTDSIPATLNINVLSSKEMARHPYIGYSLANVIVNYRTQHGAFSSPESLKNVPLISEEIFRKLAPYLNFRTE